MRKLQLTELNRISASEFKETLKTPLVVVLDDVRSLHNIGSVFRTADAFLIEKICLCGITATPPSAEIHKSALGAEDTVLWSYYSTTLQVIEALKSDGYVICAVEQVKGSTMLNEFEIDRTKKYAVILGNEVKGVNQAVVDQADCCIEIPQYGTKHSLNVSITAGIVMWELFQKLKID